MKEVLILVVAVLVYLALADDSIDNQRHLGSVYIVLIRFLDSAHC